MRRAALFLLLSSGCHCESWSTYAREHGCYEIRREPNTCQMMNVVGWYEVGDVQMPIYMSQPYECDDVIYQCDNGQVRR